MRYIESTKNLITVGNSVGITLGTEAAKMGKGVRDEIGVIVFEPELLDEAVARLEQDGRNRYFISVHLDGELIENEVVYDVLPGASVRRTGIVSRSLALSIPSGRA